MKKLIALACAASLAGCASTSGLSTGTITPQQVIADAQAIALGLCAVAPTATAITQIIIANKNNAQASAAQAQQAATIFCQAVAGTAAH